MKLSSKIFLGMFIPSIIIIITIVSMLIKSNFNNELDLVRDKSVQEYKNIIEKFSQIYKNKGETVLVSPFSFAISSYSLFFQPFFFTSPARFLIAKG